MCPVTQAIFSSSALLATVVIAILVCVMRLIIFTRYSGFLVIYWHMRSDNDQMTDPVLTTFSLQWLFFWIEGRALLTIVVSSIILLCLLMTSSSLKWVLTINMYLSQHDENKKSAWLVSSDRHSLQWLCYRMSRMISSTEQSYFSE